MNINNTQNNSFTKLISTIGGTSDQWNSVYTTTNSNSANWILSGGNTFGNEFSIGTKDAYSLSLKTNNTNRVTILSTGEVIINKLPIVNGIVGSLSSIGNALDVRGTAVVYSEISSLTSLSALSGSSPGQFSAGGMLIGQNAGGAYIGRVGIRENSWQVLSATIGERWDARQSNRDWNSVAMSSDGRIQTAAATTSSKIYTSYDYGVTWNAVGPTLYWIGVAMSSDGRIQAIISESGAEYVYISYDYGVNWTPKSSPKNRHGIAMSSDGRVIITASRNDLLSISYDYGETWTETQSTRLWGTAIAMSSDGRIIAAGVDDSGVGSAIYISYDYGKTWIARESARYWKRIAMSSDGRIQTAVSRGGSIYTSYDYGQTWNQLLNFDFWWSAAMSSDGRIQVVGNEGAGAYVSIDYGKTWTLKFNVGYVYGAAISSDGRVITVAVKGGKIYTSIASILTPNPITVLGTISATNVIYSSGGNSDQWNSVYTTVSAFSASWEESADIQAVIDDVTNLAVASGSWNSVYTSFNAQSANNASVYTFTNSNSANWILSGGNNFGSDFSIGTKDAYSLSLKTNNTNRIAILSTGEVIINTLPIVDGIVGIVGSLSSIGNALDVRGTAVVYSEISSLTSLSALSGSSPGQFSAGGMLIGQNAGGAYIGRTSIAESYWSAASGQIGNNLTNILSTQDTFRNICNSSDGSKVVCTITSSTNNIIYISNDFGKTFTSSLVSSTIKFNSLDMSSDGRIIMVAGTDSSGSVISYNGGESWVSTSLPDSNWNSISMSSDGRVIYASADNFSGSQYFYVSYNYGLNWIRITSITRPGRVVASSDGRIAVIGSRTSNNIYITNDYGKTWKLIFVAAGSYNAAAISSDGRNITIGTLYNFYVYVSNDYGNTWKAVNPGGSVSSSSNYYDVVKMSSSGKIQIVNISGGATVPTYISYNYGNNWVTLPSSGFSNCSMSSDGRVVYFSVRDFNYTPAVVTVFRSIVNICTPGPITVLGTISATDVIYASGGNSNLWNSVYTSTNSNSALWNSVYLTVSALSASWEDSADIQAVVDDVSNLAVASGSWDTAFNRTTIIANTSANWDSAYNTVNNNSTSWDTAFNRTTNIASTSSTWNSVYSLTNSTSSSYIRGTDWNTGSISSVYNWSGVAYGNGIFVAVASNYGIAYSRDGINWVINSSAIITSPWSSVTFGRGIFVAVANGDPRVYTSPDGINWTVRTAETSNWKSVTYGNGLFVAVANGGTNRVMYSNDGITWTPISVSALGWSAVAYGNGVFVAVSNTAGSPSINRVMTSPDGITWTIRAAASTDQWISLTYGNGLFVAGATSGTARIMTSPDGITWTSRAVTGGNWTSITYGNGVYVASSTTASGSKWMYSFDGINWTVKTGTETETYAATTYGNGMFIILANNGTNRALYSGKLLTNETLDNIRLGGYTVIGLLSTTGIVYASGGNSDQWNSAYTNSGRWESVYSSYNSISGRYTTLDYLSTQNVLLSSATITDYLSTNTIYSNGTTGIISDSSAETGYGNFTLTLKFNNGIYVKNNLNALSNLSAGNIVYAQGGNSLLWNSSYTTVSANSANWNSVYSNSGKYDSVYTTTNSNSANWNSVYTSFNSNSGKYDSVYTTTNSNSATWYSYTQNFGVYNTNLATVDPVVLWIPTLSGVLPGTEISSRLFTSRGKIRGRIFMNMVNSVVNKNLYLKFANNNIFTSSTNIINAGNANTQTWIRTFEGILLPGNQIIFSPYQGNVEDGLRNNPFTTYSYTPGDSIYYQVGVSIGSGSEFVAISGGYISISPD